MLNKLGWKDVHLRGLRIGLGFFPDFVGFCVCCVCLVWGVGCVF